MRDGSRVFRYRLAAPCAVAAAVAACGIEDQGLDFVEPELEGGAGAPSGDAGGGGGAPPVSCWGAQKDCGGKCVDVKDPKYGCAKTGGTPAACAPCDPKNATPGCMNNACVIQSCLPGFADCDGLVANGCEASLETVTNCGGCGVPCAPPNATGQCAGQKCAVAACNPGYADCDGNPANGCEVNVGLNVNNCGACGKTCPVTAGCTVATCVGGACKCSNCAAGKADCDGNPANGCEVTLGADVANCGGCGLQCVVPNGSPKCDNGTCKIGGCNDPFKDCNAQYADGCETNAAQDVKHCGSCAPCALQHATPKCDNGKCKIQICEGLWDDCDNTASNGCEADLGSSPGNCGACGTNCAAPNAQTACNQAQCKFIGCNTGWGNCDAIPGNGCEANLGTDLKNCGSCGNPCGAVTNGTAGCVAGKCGVAGCNAPWKNCNGQYADGCEVDSSSDTAHCGACGAACSVANGTAGCTAGACGIATCTAPWADCDKVYQTGCETNTKTDAQNCNGCGQKCPPVANGAPGCSGGACGIGSCTSAWKDCNGQASDGCEVNTAADPLNCGDCAKPCPVPANGTAACSAGKCVVGSCVSPWLDCNGQFSDGCEANKLTSDEHCGKCGAKCSAPGTCIAGVCVQPDAGPGDGGAGD